MKEITVISRCPICKAETKVDGVPGDLGIKDGSTATVLCGKCEGFLFAGCKHRKTAVEIRDLINLRKHAAEDFIPKRRQAISLAKVLIREVVAA